MKSEEPYSDYNNRTTRKKRRKLEPSNEHPKENAALLNAKKKRAIKKSNYVEEGLKQD